MRIEHIALYTGDIERLRSFYIKYFSAVSGEMYHNPKKGLKTYFLTFEGGARLELMTRPETEDKERNPYKTGYIHTAFSTGSKEKVDSLTKRLENDGFIIAGQPRVTGDGYYESVVLDPDGNFIEITV